jgi:hypothetical protein
MPLQHPWLSHYPDSVPANVELPTESLATLIAHAAQVDPDATATITDPIEKEPCTSAKSWYS